jgi:hypothetical protein
MVDRHRTGCVNIYTVYTFMYAKLFSRITESSIMEERMEVRYTFVLLLAIADPTGHVIGTDVAIARRLNMPLDLFLECIDKLGQPDASSNSKDEDGRRVIPSTGERGYRIVNYPKYRDIKDEEDRREYMRKYMQEYRKERSVNSVNSRKPKLAQLTQADAAVDAAVHVPESTAYLSAPNGETYPTEVQVLEECSMRGIPPDAGTRFWLHFESSGWRDKNGHAIHNWRTKVRSWWTMEQEKSAKEKNANTGRPGAKTPADDRNSWITPKSEENRRIEEAALQRRKAAQMAEIDALRKRSVA